jgi:hypothetical protein
MTTKEELALQIDVAQWEWLRAHNERGSLIIVDRNLDQAEVGTRLAADDAAAIQGWLDAKLLGKPTAEQIAAWDSTPNVEFSILIISPFVLIQHRN